MSILTSQSESVRADSQIWRGYMKSAVRRLDDLLHRLELSESPEFGALAEKKFGVFVPLPFLDRMEVGNPDDPLLKQVLPVRDEDLKLENFVDDPLDEESAFLKPGLLQKYKGRVLLITTSACAIHCRYCFRREFSYSQTPVSLKQWQPALDQIASDPSIEEVIFSGGDPLTMIDERLEDLVFALEKIRHLKKLRFHTRLPIMIPSRIHSRFLSLMQMTRFQKIMVIHCNHANEIDESVQSRLKALKNAGVMLLNQSVLLKGINDQVQTLVKLSKRLLDCDVLPYYLHQLDRVHGSGHFEVDRQRGEELIGLMRSELPGYGVPKFAKEIPGEPSKTVWA
ncbi:MAG: EF-P beta-lysylation protein EpmB [Planctomycetota bacterium]